jgi:hypothetical protein
VIGGAEVWWGGSRGATEVRRAKTLFAELPARNT